MSGRGRSNAADGRFGEGDKVEVLSSEEGFSDAWASANVVGPCKGGWLVEYTKFVDGDGQQLREKVRCAPCDLQSAQTSSAHAQRTHTHVGAGWLSDGCSAPLDAGGKRFSVCGRSGRCGRRISSADSDARDACHGCGLAGLSARSSPHMVYALAVSLGSLLSCRPQVPQHRLRHVPLFPTAFKVVEGMRVEGYLHDCWWPGEVVEQVRRAPWCV